jgi:tetratricopeptide (TPR) repeat protein
MDIEQLIASGKYADAAVEARRLGDLVRAQQLYERIWDWRAAAAVARERGDRPELLRLLLEARDFVEAARVGEALHGGAAVEQERGAETYERRRMWGEAAALRERLGQLEKARALYIQAQQSLEAARLDETLGRVREAGIAYEKLLASEPDSADAPRAHLALGRILAGFGRHDEAARHLQMALLTPPGGAPPVVDGAAATRAKRLLVAELAALGYRDAARAVLDPLRAADPSLPPLDALVTLEKRAAASDSGARLGGRYRVARLLGSGGMGRVYLARDEFSGRDVAVKVVAPPVDARSAEGYRRFLREAGVVSALRHPHIVSVVASHEELGLLAMEYMAGGTLADRLGMPAPMAPARVRSWALEVLAGLEAAHAHGVIHRDLKPQNIFFAASGEAKLGDFGVAHLVDLGATQTAGFIGTLAYMSPEQITGAHLGFSADVYALGVTLFQALTGRLPFGGPDFVGQHLGERPPAPSSVLGELQPWDALVMRALAKVPQERFASLEELRRAIGAVPIEPTATVAATVAASAAPAAPSTGERYHVTATLDGGLVQATDTRLGREVVLETLAADAAQVPWLRAVARWGGVRLQRVLRLEPIGDGLLRVVYEAVAGRTPRPPTLTAHEEALLLRALAPLHAAGIAHGNIADAIVLEEHGPALLIAGHRPGGAATVDDDRAQLAALVRAT